MTRCLEGGLSNCVRRHMDLLIGVGLILLALFPRAFGLGIYWTADENTYLGRSLTYLDAISRRDWGGTYFQDAIPGVTNAWCGAVGILLYYLPRISFGPTGLLVTDKPLKEVFEPTLAVLAITRLITVVLSLCLVLATYLVMRDVKDRLTAILAALFIAFDPFYVALSRILGPDPLQATFALVSVLCLSLALKRRRHKWIALSGACGGLALLSKVTAVVLIPLVALFIVVEAVVPDEKRKTAPILVSFLLWVAVALIVFFVAWPSMWVQPLLTLGAVWHQIAYNVNTPHVGGQFFWGAPSVDPGLGFYPVVIAMRTTPWVLLGAVITLPCVWNWLREALQGHQDPHKIPIVLFWATAIIYPLALTFGAEKSDHLSLVTFLVLDILAAIGWVTVLRTLLRPRPSLVATSISLLVLAQVALTLAHYPYYFSYANPALGGTAVAAKTIPMGWGEGLEQAGRYINALPDAARLTVGTRWAHTFERYFPGQAVGFPPRRAPQRYWPMQLDYAVVYISDMQRFGLPRTFQELYASAGPELLVKVNGVEWVWVYKIDKDKLRTLPRNVVPMDIAFGPEMRLAGCQMYPIQAKANAGKPILPLTLYWRITEACPGDSKLVFSVVGSTGKVVGNLELALPCVGWKESWPKDVFFPDEVNIPFEPASDPGFYQVSLEWIRIPNEQTLTGAIRLGSVDFPLPPR